MPSPRREQSANQLSNRASTGQAIKRGEITISDPIPSSFTHSNAPAGDAHAYDQLAVTLRLESTWLRSDGTASTSSLGRNHGTSNAIHVSRFTERTSVANPVLGSFNTISGSPMRDQSNPRRSGIRATIRRMFSKKARAEEHGATSDRSQSMRFPKHSTSFNTTPLLEDVHPKPGVSSPHTRGESESAVRKLHEPIHDLGKRRNTEPSLLTSQLALSTILSQDEAAGTDAAQPPLRAQSIAQSMTRPSTSAAQSKDLSVQAKRRSRSADNLREMSQAANDRSKSRDRSAEIAFWRNSFVMDPVPSLPNAEHFRPLEYIQESHDRSPEGSPQARPSLEPVQDFDFDLGNNVNVEQSINLRDRVNTLEVKLYDFEFALAKLQGVDVSKPNLPKRPSRRKSLRGAFPQFEDSSTEQSSNDISYPSSSSERLTTISPREHIYDRTSKATTIKPIHRRTTSKSSQVSTRTSIRLTRNEYEALQSLIHGEKLARQQLEVVVLSLQKEVEILKSPIYPYQRTTKYPTPSPDSDYENMALRTPRLMHHSPKPVPECNINETSRFSMTETDSDLDDTFPEVYETPEEENFIFSRSGGSRAARI